MKNKIDRPRTCNLLVYTYTHKILTKHWGHWVFILPHALTYAFASAFIQLQKPNKKKKNETLIMSVFFVLVIVFLTSVDTVFLCDWITYTKFYRDLAENSYVIDVSVQLECTFFWHVVPHVELCRLILLLWYRENVLFFCQDLRQYRANSFRRQKEKSMVFKKKQKTHDLIESRLMRTKCLRP